MRSGHLLALLLLLEGLLTAHAQISVGTSLGAAALGAAVAGGVGLLALGAARRGARRGRRRGGRRNGRSAEDETDLPSDFMMRLAAAQDGSGCAQKLVCLLAASETLSPLESDIVEFVQTRRAALGPAALAAAPAAVRPVGQKFQAAKQLGETGGDCTATYSGCPFSQEQLTQLAARRVAAARGRLAGAGK